LYAGNHRPHKDLPTLVRAWASLPEHYAVDLLLTGEVEPAFAGTRRARGELLFLGERSDDELWRFFRSAAAYVHPALREGFGLPALEALRAGTPVLATAEATPSVLRAHVELFPAGDATALSAQIVRVLDAPESARARAEHGRDATAYLTWERTVRETANVYRELLA
jgi:glycosyltransferase involved in cell wall biosynthesis